MCSHGKYVMMKVIDGYKLKLMNSPETVHQNSLAYLFGSTSLPSNSERAGSDELWMCSKHLENSSLAFMYTCIDATEEN